MSAWAECPGEPLLDVGRRPRLALSTTVKSRPEHPEMQDHRSGMNEPGVVSFELQVRQVGSIPAETVLSSRKPLLVQLREACPQPAHRLGIRERPRGIDDHPARSAGNPRMNVTSAQWILACWHLQLRTARSRVLFPPPSYPARSDGPGYDRWVKIGVRGAGALDHPSRPGVQQGQQAIVYEVDLDGADAPEIIAHHACSWPRGLESADEAA